MADFQTVASCIETAFNTGFAAAQPSVPFFFAGQDVTAAQKGKDPWARLTINFGQSEQASMGDQKNVRTPGIATVQVFVPAGGGYGPGRRIADSIASIWQVSTINGILFRATSLIPAGVDGPWVQMNANTPFQADELVT